MHRWYKNGGAVKATLIILATQVNINTKSSTIRSITNKVIIRSSKQPIQVNPYKAQTNIVTKHLYSMKQLKKNKG